MREYFKHHTVTIACTLLLIAQTVCAGNTSVTHEAAAPLPVMPSVQVEATRIAPTTGTFIIDKEMIDNLPVRNGSVNEIIGIVPGVQYSETQSSSYTGGEITPPVVSISGSRFYDNNYTIDGFSNNNTLDPAYMTATGANKLPGHPQIHFLNPNIIEQITVYDSNIPAEFGGFTGGQVDTLTISPTAELWGNISYRTTRDSWTEFHIQPAKEETFNNSSSAEMQPDFKKDDLGFIINLPVTNDTGVVFSYQQLKSKIPLHYLDERSTQTRKNENFFLKVDHYLPDNSLISLTALYTPTSSDYFRGNVKESDYSIDNDNHSIGLHYEKTLSLGQLDINAGYTVQKMERQAPIDRFQWDPDQPSIDWESGIEGWLGPLKINQDRVSLTSDFSFKQINLWETNHQIKIGFEATHAGQSYNRPSTSYIYSRPVIGPVICMDGDPACIDGEQYLRSRTIYNRGKNSVTINDYAAYLQDSIVWKRLELFPGVRFSYDEYTKKTNVAPRFSASLDLLGNKKTILFTGINRYYSGTLLTHALYSSIVVEGQTRSTATDWNPPRTYYRYGESDVKTPYTDEITLGAIQQLFGGTLKLQYTKKDSRDEFARETIDRTYYLNNYGRSKHESIKVSWQRSWKKHYLELNSTWQKTTTTHKDYFSKLTEDRSQETFWYDNEELHWYEMPRKDFNRPIIANLVYICELPYGFTFTNTTKYRGTYWRLNRTREDRPSTIHPGEMIDVYERVKGHSSTVFNWKINWKIPKTSQRNIVLSLDILNVFDQKIEMGYASSSDKYGYEIGRQIWAGLDFNF